LSLARFRPDNPDVAGPSDGRASSAPHVRVSDAERDAALARLRDGFADGRLTHETFSYRVDEALRARADHELRRLVADLPTSRRLRAVARAACLRVIRATDRWLRGWPPALTLPAGSQRRFTIGRELDCDMTLADETVSRWHASLERAAAGGWLLADLGSTNGTRLNGWRVTSPIPVRPGDMVSFGAATYVLSERPG
jgi:Domain of unknown function (DUF1707)/FHA domain